jgi:hypothetical protein
MNEQLTSSDFFGHRTDAMSIPQPRAADLNVNLKF